MLERARKREEEQQHRSFAPGANARAACRHRQHQKVHVNGAFLEPFPNLLGRKPTAGQISQRITHQ